MGGLPVRIPGLYLACGLFLGACGDATAPPLPTVVAAHAAETDHAQVRSLTVQLSAPGAAEVVWQTDGEPALRLRSEVDAASHAFTLTRLLPGRSYRIEARALAGERRGEAWDTTIGTGELPSALAEFTFETQGMPTAPLTLLEIVGSAPGWTGAIVVDGSGRIVWHRASEGALFGTALRPDGNILFLDNTLGIVEVSVDGRVVRTLPQRTAPYGEIHHDLTVTPAGTVLFLARDAREVGGEEVVGEAIWEWDAVTGSVAKRWSSHDFFRWPEEVGERSSAGNWQHANSIEVGVRGNVIVSGRNTDQVWSVAPGYGSVEWRLGGAGATLPLTSADLFFGQHGAREVAEDRIILFDNGFGRAEGSFSRVLEFEIDRGAGTARKVWEYRPSPDIFAALVGSVRRLGNGNTLVNFGMTQGHVASTGPLRIVEVDAAGGEVWRLSPGPAITRVYRATPLAALAGEGPGATGS